MNLTQQNRRTILGRLVAVTFDARIENVRKRHNELAVAVRDYTMTPSEIELLKSVPKKWLRMGGYLNASRNNEGRSNDYWQLNFLSEEVVPNHLYASAVNLPTEDPVAAALIEEIVEFKAIRDGLEQDTETFREKTKAVLNTFKTVEKLLESWPTIKEVMPEGYFKPTEKVALPTTTINALDEQVRASMIKETPSK